MFSALGECSVSPTFSLLMKVLELRHSVMLVNLSQILKKRMAPIILSSVAWAYGQQAASYPSDPAKGPHVCASLACLPALCWFTQSHPGFLRTEVSQRQQCKGVSRSNSAGGTVYGIYTLEYQHLTSHAISPPGLQWDMWSQGHLHQNQAQMAGVQPTQRLDL